MADGSVGVAVVEVEVIEGEMEMENVVFEVVPGYAQYQFANSTETRA